MARSPTSVPSSFLHLRPLDRLRSTPISSALISLLLTKSPNEGAHPMKSRYSRRQLALILIPAAVISSTSCVSDKALKVAIDRQLPLRDPARVTRPIDADLERFGAMIRAYRTEDSDLVLAVDFMPNDSGISKELPEDIGSYGRTVLEHIGPPVVTYRTLPAVVGLKGPAANSIFLTGPPPKPPAAAFKLVGVLERASEQVTAAKNGRV